MSSKKGKSFISKKKIFTRKKIIKADESEENMHNIKNMVSDIKATSLLLLCKFYKVNERYFFKIYFHRLI